MTQNLAGAITEPAFSEVGIRVRAARAKVGMTRKQLAETSDTSERYLANIEGGIGNPSLSVISALARALDVAPSELLPLGGEIDTLRAEAAAALRRLPDDRIAAVQAWMQQGTPAADLQGQRITLVGLRGAGKSSLGAKLADALSMRFIEISKEVAKLYGGEIGLLIELGGQAALRQYEHQVWETLLDSTESAVIATPGRIVADPSLYERILATSHTIWLEATPADHMARVMAQGDFRPMESNKAPMEDLKSILEARSPEYARAEARLNTSAQPFDQTLDALAALSRRLLTV